MASSPHILIVDDDRDIRDLLARFLGKHGYRVTAVVDGRDMRKALGDRAIDLIVLDVMLPGEDGLALCSAVRGMSSVPIVMLTAMGDDVDRIVGLEMGADDYLGKPFNPRELLARIKAVLRRTTGLPPRSNGVADDADDDGRGCRTLAFDGWVLHLDQRTLVSPQGLLVPLSTGEFDLLAAFASHPQRILSRDQLLDLARGRDAQPFDRSIDVQVSRLRRKIETDPGDPALIKTVRGGGYLFAPKVQRQ